MLRVAVALDAMQGAELPVPIALAVHGSRGAAVSRTAVKHTLRRGTVVGNPPTRYHGLQFARGSCCAQRHSIRHSADETLDRAPILAGLAVTVLVLASYLAVARPSQFRWGETDPEIVRDMPGDAWSLGPT